VYKVTNPNPDIIARTIDDPLPVDAFTLEHSSPQKAYDKLKKLETFLSNRSVSTVKKIERVHAYVDWTMQDLKLPELAVCQRGCAHCCTIDVEVGFIEAVYIAHKTGLTVLNRKKRKRSDYHLRDHYCHFLDQSNGECTIHDIRPMVCRSFFTFDNPKFCQSFEAHAIYGTKGNPAVQHLEFELFRQGGNRSADIREWFLEHQT